MVKKGEVRVTIVTSCAGLTELGGVVGSVVRDLTKAVQQKGVPETTTGFWQERLDIIGKIDNQIQKTLIKKC